MDEFIASLLPLLREHGLFLSPCANHENFLRLLHTALLTKKAHRERTAQAGRVQLSFKAVDHPRETAAHGTKRPGEFAPKGERGKAGVPGVSGSSGSRTAHHQAVDLLKNLPKGKRWLNSQALQLVQSLDKDSFTKPPDYAEAVTAAVIGHRWQAAVGKSGYDTANMLSRWMGAAAERFGNPEIHFDAKTQREGIGYTDKVPERANKASAYLRVRDTGKGAINGVIFHTRQGIFFQLGIDHQSGGPQFGKGKRSIVRPEELPQYIDGQGGVLPAVMLSSKTTWQETEFAGLGEGGIRDINHNLGKILNAILGGVGMEKVQEHLDDQAKKAVEQATRKMMQTRSAKGIVVETVVEEDPERVADELVNAAGDAALLELEKKIQEAKRKRGLK